MRKIILWAHGVDRCGIVAGVTGVLLGQGFNLEDTSMTILEGHFAMIVIASRGGRFTLKGLETALAGVKKTHGLEFTLRFFEKPISAGRKSRAAAPVPAIVTVFGMDRPGIVHHVAAFLAAAKVNITDVSSHVTGKENEPIYVMALDVELPAALKHDRFQAGLEKLGSGMNAQIGLSIIGTGVL